MRLVNGVKSNLFETSYGHVGDYNIFTQLEKEDLTINTFLYGVNSEYDDILGLELTPGSLV